MKTQYVAIAVLSAMICNPFNAAAEGKGGVAAVVNGEKLTVAEIKEAYDAAPQIKSQVTFEQFYPQAVTNWVGVRVVNQAAAKSDIKSTKEYKETLKAFEQELAGRLLIQQQVLKNVKDTDVKNLYNQYKSEFKPEKEIKARQILVNDETTAKDIIGKLKKGSKFEDLTKYSKDKNTDLGYFTQKMMIPEFGDVVFKMKKGEYSQTPIKTKNGYHIVIVDDVRNTKLLSYDQLAPQLQAMLAQKEVAAYMKKLTNDAKLEAYSLDGKPIDLKAQINGTAK